MNFAIQPILRAPGVPAMACPVCAAFQTMRPRTVVITTPNAEFNPLLGVPSSRMRNPRHRFEWDRAQFRRWCARVANDTGYIADVHNIAGLHPDLGGASQMAVFELNQRETRKKAA